ncbi:MAG: PorV/PorQ family protein [Bacteroidetes bacterium]|nr:PorV/PorQ family protein [Bacteroidota bacterium]
MKNTKIIIALLIIGLLTNAIYSQDRDKRAQTGLKFLSVSNDARSTAFGGAVTSLEINNSSAIFFNPASMANQTNFATATLGMTQWIADINYTYASLAFAPFDGDYGVVGFAYTAVDYGKLDRTIRSGLGYIDLGKFSPSAMSFGLSYAIALSEKFSVGGNVKYVYQDLSGGHVVGFNTDGSYQKKSFDIDVTAFDFGIIYKTGFKSLNIGMNIRNFSEELTYIEESFQLPLTFKIGASINVMDLIQMGDDFQKLLVSVDAVHSRDFDEQLNMGFEYTVFDAVSLRLGYIYPTDEQGINAGIGVQQELAGLRMGVDYAYLDFGIFDQVHQFTLNFAF